MSMTDVGGLFVTAGWWGGYKAIPAGGLTLAHLVSKGEPHPLASEPILVNGKKVGYVTSGMHGYRTGKTLVLGYIERGALEMGAECEVCILGEPHSAIRHSPHQYDPTNARLKS